MGASSPAIGNVVPEDVAKKERAMMLSLIVLLGMGLLQDGDQKASERGFGNLGRLRSLDPLVL